MIYSLIMRDGGNMGNIEKVHEIYECAIAQVPLTQEK